MKEISAMSALTLTERQPVAVRAALVATVTAIVHVLVVLGVVDVDTEQAIATAVDALGGLVLVLWTIRAVTPNAKVIARVTTDGGVVAGDAAVAPTGSDLDVDEGPGVYVGVRPSLVDDTAA